MAISDSETARIIRLIRESAESMIYCCDHWNDSGDTGEDKLIGLASCVEPINHAFVRLGGKL